MESRIERLAERASFPDLVPPLERLRSGIPGFDRLVGGGLITGNVYLLCGSPGTGKTTFSMQYMLYGLIHDENGLYVTCEEPAGQIRRHMSSYNWDLVRYERSERLIILDATVHKTGVQADDERQFEMPLTLDTMLFDIQKCVNEIGAKRVVIDCLDTLELQTDDIQEFRRYLLRMAGLLKSTGCTSILISEVPEEGKFSRYGVEEFVADGIIVLHHPTARIKSDTTGRTRTMRVRTIEIKKMRGTRISPFHHPCKITEDGFLVGPV